LKKNKKRGVFLWQSHKNDILILLRKTATSTATSTAKLSSISIFNLPSASSYLKLRLWLQLRLKKLSKIFSCGCHTYRLAEMNSE